MHDVEALGERRRVAARPPPPGPRPRPASNGSRPRLGRERTLLLRAVATRDRRAARSAHPPATCRSGATAARAHRARRNIAAGVSPPLIAHANRRPVGDRPADRLGDEVGGAPPHGFRVGKDLHGDHQSATWPPNSRRIAESTRFANAASSRDANRANRAAVSTSAGAPDSIAVDRGPSALARVGDAARRTPRGRRPRAGRRPRGRATTRTRRCPGARPPPPRRRRSDTRRARSRRASGCSALRRRRPSARTRCRCGPSSRSARTRPVRSGGSPAPRGTGPRLGLASGGRRRRPGASDAKMGSRCSTTSTSPPTIRQKPRSSPNTPPLVPQSTYRIPRSRSSLARRTSSR